MGNLFETIIDLKKSGESPVLSIIVRAEEPTLRKIETKMVILKDAVLLERRRRSAKRGIQKKAFSRLQATIVLSNQSIIVRTLETKSLLPSLYKREEFPLFGKEGLPACAKPLRRRQGGDFRKNMSNELWTP